MSYMMIFQVYNFSNNAFQRYVPNFSDLYLPNVVNKVIWASCSYLQNQSGSYLQNQSSIYLPDVIKKGIFGILGDLSRFWGLKKKCP